jgi:phage gp46-like protein
MDSRIDPTTGDYDRTRISDLSNAVYLRITVPLGTYWADPTLGSKLYQLVGVKDLQRYKTLAIQYAQEALQPLIDDKRADRIDIDATWAHDGRLELAGTVYQANRVTFNFQHYVKVA